MEQCLIEGCPNEAKMIAKSGGRKYYACKEHRKEVAQIAAVEFSLGEKERYIRAKERMYSNKDIPEFMRI